MSTEPTSVLPLLANPALAPDAPIHHLLSLRLNPRVAEMSTDELRRMCQELRLLATQQPTQTARLRLESDGIKERAPRKLTAKAIKISSALNED